MLLNYLVKGNFSRPRMQRFVVIGMALCLCAFHANAQTAMISSGDFTVSPSQVTPGQQDVTIVIKSLDCKKANLTELLLGEPSSKDVTIKNVPIATKDGCNLYVKVDISKSAQDGTVYFPIGNDLEHPLCSVSIDISQTLRGPIPPALKEPEVDVMWSVVPKSIVQDNFGKSISLKYYCIEVVIGNNTGYQLQIASVAFTLGMPSNPSDGDQNKIPTSSYQMTRGTLERAHEDGPRARKLHVIQALGPILTGFIPFFHAVNPRANYSTGTSIFNGPFEQGWQLIFPDTTLRQLSRLDGESLRDGIVIPNNTQIRTVVFFPKELLKNEVDIEDKDDPGVVRDALAQLVIVGDVIRHLERVRVVSTPPPGPVSPTGGASPLAGPSNSKVLGLPFEYLTPDHKAPIEDPTQDRLVRIQIVGDNLADKDLELPKELQSGGETEHGRSEDGKDILVKEIKIPKTTKAGSYTINIPSAGQITFKVDKKKP